jgi:hypothetical protein
VAAFAATDTMPALSGQDVAMFYLFSIAKAASNFWSDTYHGRKIAAYLQGSDWLVYLDIVMLPNRALASIEDAVRWLHRKVDDGAFDSRIATLCSRHAGRRRKVRFSAL